MIQSEANTDNDPPAIEVDCYIKSATFSSGQNIKFNKNEIAVFIGANNSGKSQTLLGLFQKFNDSRTSNHVVSKIEVERIGSMNELTKWMNENFTTKDVLGGIQYEGLNFSLQATQLTHAWSSEHESYPLRPGLSGLSAAFATWLGASERLSATNPTPNIRLTQDRPHHAFHILQREQALEDVISSLFKKAFDWDIRVARNGGSETFLYCGIAPVGSRLEVSYQLELEKMPMLHVQGDGMKAFAGILLNTLVAPKRILLLDEPEAFLHPPQARLIGEMLVEQLPNNCQLFISTHSSDILRGFLDSNSSRVKLYRIERKKDKNFIHELPNEDVRNLWDTPLLRYSDVLDAAFHQCAVICESDADCRFYSAILDALIKNKNENDLLRKTDFKFINVGGKHRLKLVAATLSKLFVPNVIITDLDAFNEKSTISELISTAGGDWEKFESNWKVVFQAIKDKQTPLKTLHIKKALSEVVNNVSDKIFPTDASNLIRDIVKQSSPWEEAKKHGINILNGPPHLSAKKLLADLLEIGIAVVPVGQLESFWKGCSLHGPGWVEEALKQDLLSSDFKVSRDFVSTVLTKRTFTKINGD